MATSQNGWPVHTSSRDLVPLRWITGRVAPGDVYAIFSRLCERFDAEVEQIDPSISWGWANRPIRGSDRISNHASATAIDLNAPFHPLGQADTFRPVQVERIRAILADLERVVRWGGDYAGRKDEMHFEIDAPTAVVAVVARRIGTVTTTPVPDWEDLMAVTTLDDATDIALYNYREAGQNPTRDNAGVQSWAIQFLMHPDPWAKFNRQRAALKLEPWA